MAALLKEQEIAGEVVMVLREDLVLIRSRSEPGVWHAVETLHGHPHCTCRGFQFRAICRHLKTANEAVTAWESAEGADTEYMRWLEVHAPEAEAVGA